MNPVKLAIANVLDLTGVNSLLLKARSRTTPAHIRVVNYHDIPPSTADRFEAQLRFYRDHFCSAGPEQFAALARGEWNEPRPGLAITFDDGLRSHAEVAAPLLEEYGFVGWFMVPVGFVDTPIAEQADFAARHQIGAAPEYDDPRIAMSWDQARALASSHVIGLHTRNHTRLAASLTPAQLQDEIPGAKLRLEQQLGQPVSVFCWVGGEEWAYSAEAARLIRQTGFDYSFMTNNAIFRGGNDPHQIQRSNVEARMSMSLMRFHLSGLMDLFYTAKRRRVCRLTSS